MATTVLIFKGSSQTVGIPGSTKDFTVRLVVDNGNDSIADQEWRPEHFVSAELTSGSYTLRWSPAQPTTFFAKTDGAGKVVQASMAGLMLGSDVFADSAANGGHLTAASNNSFIRDTQMRQNAHTVETDASMRRQDDNNHLWSVEKLVKRGLLIPDLAESYARFDGRAGTFSESPWHLEPGHSAQLTIDGSGMSGQGLSATHEATHAGNWLARDNQKFGVLRYRWNAPMRLEGIALWQASSFRGGFSWKSFDVWVKQGAAYVRVADALSMPNPPEPGAFRVDFPRTVQGVTEVVLEIHTTHSVDGRIEAGLGEFRAIGEPGVEAAQAVTFEVKRLSDTQAIVTASGSFAAKTPSQRGARVMLVAPLAQAKDGAAELADNTMASTNGSKLTGADTFAKTFKAGGKTVQALRLVFDLNHAEGDSVSGSARLQLPAGCVLAPVGSSGEVWYGNDNRANLSTRTGQWTLVEGKADEAVDPATSPCDPSGDFDFTISAKLVGEERIDPHEEEATIEVTIGTRISPDTIWRLSRASLVLDLDGVPGTIALGPGTKFSLDVKAMNKQQEVVVPLTVKTGTFAGADTAAAAGDYPIRATIDASYKTGLVRGKSEGGTFNVTVARD